MTQMEDEPSLYIGVMFRRRTVAGIKGENQDATEYTWQGFGKLRIRIPPAYRYFFYVFIKLSKFFSFFPLSFYSFPFFF